MVSYVESATFKVIDQSSGPLAKIRKSLDAMNKAADALAKKGEASQKAIGTAATNSARQQVAAIRRVDSVAETAHRGTRRRISEEAAARRQAAREAQADIRRQIGAAQVEGRRQRAEIAATERANRAAIDRQIRSASVEQRRRIADEREASRQRAQSAREVARMQREANEAAQRVDNRGAARQIAADLQRQAQAHQQATTAARQRATAERQITAAIRGRGTADAAAGLAALSPIAAAQRLFDEWRRTREEKKQQQQSSGTAAGILGGAVAGKTVAGSQRAAAKSLEDRIALVEGTFGKRSNRAQIAAADLEAKEKKLAKARADAAAAATKAATSGAQKDLTTAERRANAVTRAEKAVDTARRASEIAAADLATGTLRRQVQIDNANRNAQRQQERATAQKIDRAQRVGELAGIPRTAAQIGAVVGTAKAARVAGEGIVYAQNQRELLDTLGMSDEKKSTIKRESDRLGGEYRQLSRAEFLELTRDAIVASKTTGDGVAIAEGMARNAANLALLYGNSERGMEAARQFYRAADIEGATDSKDEALVFMEQLTRETLRSGKDINARSVAQSIANMGTAKFGMSPEMIGDIVSLSDNVRGQTAAFIRQMHEQLTRFNVPDSNRAAQTAAGLRRTDGSGPVEEELFFRDKFEWTKAVVKPLVEKRLGRSLDSFVDKDGKETSGERAKKAAAIDRVLSNAGLTPSAQKLMSEYLMNQDRIERQRRDRKDVNLDRVKDLPDRNIQQAGLALKRKWQDFADRVSEPAQPVVAKALSGLADMFNYFTAKRPSEPVAENPRTGLRMPRDAGYAPLIPGIIGGGIIGAGAWAIKQATDHPEKAALTTAGVGLTGAAMKLSRAAAALTGAATSQKLAGAAGAAGAGGTAAAGAAGAGIAAASVARTLLRAAGAAGLVITAFELIRAASEAKVFGEDRKPKPDAPRFEDGTRSTVPEIDSPKITAGNVEVYGPQQPQDLKGRLEGDGYTLRERRDAMRMLREMDEQEAVRRPRWAQPENMGPDPAAITETAASMREVSATMSTLGPDLSAAMAPLVSMPGEMQSATSSGAQSILSALQEGASAVASAIAAALSQGVQVNVNTTSAPANTGAMGTAGR